MTYPIDPEVNAHADSYSSWYLWPMLSFRVYPSNMLNTYHWRPQGVDRVTVRRGRYTIDGVESDISRQLAQQNQQTTVERDVQRIGVAWPEQQGVPAGTVVDRCRRRRELGTFPPGPARLDQGSARRRRSGALIQGRCRPGQGPTERPVRLTMERRA